MPRLAKVFREIISKLLSSRSAAARLAPLFPLAIFLFFSFFFTGLFRCTCSWALLTAQAQAQAQAHLASPLSSTLGGQSIATHQVAIPAPSCPPASHMCPPIHPPPPPPPITPTELASAEATPVRLDICILSCSVHGWHWAPSLGSLQTRTWMPCTNLQAPSPCLTQDREHPFIPYPTSQISQPGLPILGRASDRAVPRFQSLLFATLFFHNNHKTTRYEHSHSHSPYFSSRRTRDAARLSAGYPQQLKLQVPVNVITALGRPDNQLDTCSCPIAETLIFFDRQGVAARRIARLALI